MNKLLQIFNHFGYKAQVEKQKEEDAEFLEAVQEYIDNPCKETMDHMIEEFADKHTVGIGIILGALKITGRFSEESEIYIRLVRNDIEQKKIDRTLDRIKSGYYDKPL